MTLLGTVTNPESFFEGRVPDVPLVPAVAVVLLVAVINAASGYLVIQHTLSALPADSQQQLGTVVYAGAIGGAVVATLVIWVVFAAVFHFLSTLVYEGEGSFRGTLAMTGWGYLPQAITALVSLGVLAYLFFVQGVPTPELSSAAAFQRYSQSLRSRPLLRATSVIGIAGTLWSGYVWISGVAAVHEIDEGDAFVVVAVPVAISVLWTLYNLL